MKLGNLFAIPASIALLAAAAALATAPLAAEDKGGGGDTKKGNADSSEAPPGQGKEGGDAGASPDPPELVKALKTLDVANSRIKTMTVPYVQHRKVRISRKIRKAEGVLRLEKRPLPAGLRVLFEETSPHRMKLLFTDEAVVFRDMETDKIETYDPRKGGIRPSEIWIMGRPIEDLRKSWEFVLGVLEGEGSESFSAMLKLVPKKKDLAKWVKEMHVWLSAKDGMPVKVKIIDPKEEYQEFVFDAAKLEMNKPIDPAVFDVEGKAVK